MAEELNKALAEYINYIYGIAVIKDYRYIVGYRYINDSNCRLAPGYSRCLILGVYDTRHRVGNPRRSMIFNKRVLTAARTLYCIELDE